MDATYQDIHVSVGYEEDYVKRKCQIKNIRFDSSWYPYIEITVIEEGKEQKLCVPITRGMKLLID